uniref:arachidonate 12-lipoxygenase, 12R-type-like n=1 Tax=Epinephelus lanceolatus TaxID=310571 RepID=UPI0014477595|nr:arachidonate 12-lipoxygenase, 12R-type-like [Epinephelus lanceolatus]
MANYEVTVKHDELAFAGTRNRIFIKLVGTDGESKRTWLHTYMGLLNIDKLPFMVIKYTFSSSLEMFLNHLSSFQVKCPVSIGKLILIELDKQHFLVKDSWFPAKVVVKSPEGHTYNFPIYSWITDSEVHSFREGTALRDFEDYSRAIQFRKQELKQRDKEYRWHVYAKRIPDCMKADSFFDLPSDIRFSFTKDVEFVYTLESGLIELELEGLVDSREKWHHVAAISQVFPVRRTDISDYVQQHWRDDDFFAYQYLNGVNPMVIKRCSALPDNFPVTDEMVFPGDQFSLADEMKGNIFLCDYKHLDGVTANTNNVTKQYLAATLVLLHKTPEDKLMPIAIRLKQTPAEDNPIFLPTDPEYDWLTAKIFVRSADFNEHQANSHLLRTHLLAEVFAVSLLRNLPMVHPLYKLLIPHTHDTLEINYMARHHLISDNGVFTKFAATGGEGLVTLLQRSLSSVTYTSLCIPEDIAERGLKDVPNFYYRDDGLKLWDIIYRFVQGVLGFYYKNDDEVKKDSELQKWISDIFEHGFLSRKGTGIPQRFTKVEELVKFVTMVIFTCSAQHSAVNTGQYDYGGWMPNSPTTLYCPPPTKKGTTIQATMMDTLPDKGTTANGMSTLWLLSKPSSDYVPLGQYPGDHFSEKMPCELIKAFQGELQVLSAHINIRNMSLEVPYTYMDPVKIENSVAI